SWPIASVEFVATVATAGAAGLYRRRKSSTQPSDAKAGTASTIASTIKTRVLTDFIEMAPYNCEESRGWRGGSGTGEMGSDPSRDNDGAGSDHPRCHRGSDPISPVPDPAPSAASF